jgi:Virulence factor BrkB
MKDRIALFVIVILACQFSPSYLARTSADQTCASTRACFEFARPVGCLDGARRFALGHAKLLSRASAQQRAGGLAQHTLLFAMMFKWLPDTYVAWRDVWPGAAVTAALFEIGKLLIGLYIGKQGLESTYGAAASLVVLLIWVYYSSQLVLMGAEFTRAFAKRRALGNISASGDPPPIAAPGVDHYVHVAAGRSAYAAAIMAFLVGWLFGRRGDRNQCAGRTRAI